MTTTICVEQYIDLSNTRTRYIEAGQGEKHLLLLHGIGVTSSADSFQLVINDLARDFHLYSLDLLGYGKGTRTIEAGPTFDLTVDHLREFMDAKGIRKTSIVGHSAGGWVAGLLAYESPQRFEKLVLLCAAGMNAEISPGVGTPRLPADKEQAAENFKRMVPDQSRLTEDQVQAILASQMDVAGQPGALHSLDTITQQMSTWEVRRRYLLHRRVDATHEQINLLGTPDQMMARLREYIDAGASKFVFNPACGADEVFDQLRLQAEAIVQPLHQKLVPLG